MLHSQFHIERLCSLFGTYGCIIQKAVPSHAFLATYAKFMPHLRQDRAGLTSSDAISNEAPSKHFNNGGAALMNAALSAAMGSCCPAVLLSISMCLGHPWPAGAASGPESTLSGMARVIDGDTLEVMGSHLCTSTPNVLGCSPELSPSSG